jgi:hypothetical protein
MDALHRISAILIERETIDRTAARLAAGEGEETVFPDETPEPEPARGKEAPAAAKPRPFLQPVGHCSRRRHLNHGLTPPVGRKMLRICAGRSGRRASRACPNDVEGMLLRRVVCVQRGKAPLLSTGDL